MIQNNPSSPNGPIPRRQTGAYNSARYYALLRYQPYRYQSTAAPLSPESTPDSHSDFLRHRTQEAIDKGPQTVEQLVTQGYFAAPKGGEMALLDDRKATSWLALDDAVTQIRQRRKIYEQNLLDLQWAECYAFNELARGGWPASEDQYSAYARALQDLGAQRRLERVAYWRDVSKVRQGLPEAVQQYLSAFRKSEILRDDGGDAP